MNSLHKSHTRDYEIHLPEALAQWRLAIGDAHVDATDETRRHYARSTSATGTHPLAVLKPASTAEVQAIVRIAAKYRIPLYPISRGSNWGLGDACAVTDKQVIVDLRRMNHIVEVNEELGYAVIEPGVSQGQMYEYLRDHKIDLILDVTGAGPEASVVGNAIERGFGHTPYGDHFAHSSDYEVVLADGRLIHTGSGAFPQSKTAKIFKHGLGPSLDGIFTQSNIGIITRMTIWLMPKPKYVRAFLFKVKREEDLPKVIEALRPLRMNGTIRSTVHIFNDYKAISSFVSRYPRDLAGGQEPLPEHLRTRLRQESRVGFWNGFGGFYDSRENADICSRALKKALRGIATVRFFDEDLIRAGEFVAKLLRPLGIGRGLTRQLHAARSSYGLLQGIPTSDHMISVGWRSRGIEAQGTNPLDNRWGFMWISPILPMTGQDAEEFVGKLKPIFKQYGFEPLLSLVMVTERTLCCVVSISFDRDDIEEAARASVCHGQMLDLILREGNIPYRAGSFWMDKLQNASEYWEVVRQIKDALDPDGILAPGRYLPLVNSTVQQTTKGETAMNNAQITTEKKTPTQSATLLTQTRPGGSVKGSLLKRLWTRIGMFIRSHIVEGWLYRKQVERFYLVFGGHIFFQTLRAAAKFDLFTLLAKHGGLSLHEVSRLLGIDEQPARIMLLGLTSSGILRKKGNKYHNTFLSNTILRSDSKRNVLSYVELEHHVMYKGMHSLYESIVENRNVGLGEFKGADPTLYQRLGNHPELEKVFQDAMSELSIQTNKHLVKLVDFSQYRHVVDIGGGDGTNAIALCREYPGLKVTVFDLPAAKDIAEANIRQAGLEGRIRFVAGNCFEDEFPKDVDCVLFCHFMTIWSKDKDQELMRKAYNCLPNGGSVVVFNMMQHNNGTGPLSAAVGSPYFLAIATGEGMLYSWNEYDAWMRQAGFKRVIQQVLPNDHGAIVGKK